MYIMEWTNKLKVGSTVILVPHSGLLSVPKTRKVLVTRITKSSVTIETGDVYSRNHGHKLGNSGAKYYTDRIVEFTKEEWESYEEAKREANKENKTRRLRHEIAEVIHTLNLDQLVTIAEVIGIKS